MDCLVTSETWPTNKLLDEWKGKTCYGQLLAAAEGILPSRTKTNKKYANMKNGKTKSCNKM